MKLTETQLSNRLYFIGASLGFRITEHAPIEVGHELAHAILLFGRVYENADEDVSTRIEAMPPRRRNRTELQAVALHIAGLRSFGCQTKIERLTRESYQGLSSAGGPDYQTLAAYRRAVLAWVPSARSVERWRRVIIELGRYAP